MEQNTEKVKEICQSENVGTNVKCYRFEDV